MLDAALLAELRDIEPDKLAAYTDWVDAHAETHLPFVAEIDGYVVGCAWLLVAQRVPGNGSLDRRYGDVQSVMVREEYRHRGIGTALMTAHQPSTQYRCRADGRDPYRAGRARTRRCYLGAFGCSWR